METAGVVSNAAAFFSLIFCTVLHSKRVDFTPLFFLQISLPKLASKYFICNIQLGLGLKFVRLKLWGLTPFDVVTGHQNIKKSVSFMLG